MPKFRSIFVGVNYIYKTPRDGLCSRVRLYNSFNKCSLHVMKGAMHVPFYNYAVSIKVRAPLAKRTMAHMPCVFVGLVVMTSPSFFPSYSTAFLESNSFCSVADISVRSPALLMNLELQKLRSNSA